jgi:hypothetical protein
MLKYFIPKRSISVIRKTFVNNFFTSLKISKQTHPVFKYNIISRQFFKSEEKKKDKENKQKEEKEHTEKEPEQEQNTKKASITKNTRITKILTNTES